uniref:Uncharacterized protein n=1 Tax=Oryza glumipatula TaxID=40148 RepID=A0A0E0BS45_9ORYZ
MAAEVAVAAVNCSSDGGHFLRRNLQRRRHQFLLTFLPQAAMAAITSGGPIHSSFSQAAPLLLISPKRHHPDQGRVTGIVFQLEPGKILVKNFVNVY